MNIQSQKPSKILFETLILLLVSLMFSANTFAYEKAKVPESIAEGASQLVQIKARADDDFLLFADYYKGGKRSGGVIVLHDCKNDRRSYNAIAKSIAEQGLHTLLVDLRGYGDSISPEYSREEAKNKSRNIVSYQSEMALITANWADDLLAIHQFLARKIDKSKGIAVVASGCSGAYVVSLAEKIHLNSMVLITPEMAYNDKEHYKTLVDIPSYFITSSHHPDSYETSQELFAWNGDKQSKIQIFKGTYYGKQLISRQRYLVNDIAFWLKFNLR